MRIVGIKDTDVTVSAHNLGGAVGPLCRSAGQAAGRSSRCPGHGIVSVLVKEGDEVERRTSRSLTIEAMKMETSVVARMAGRVDKLLAAENTAVKAGELLAVIK